MRDVVVVATIFVIFNHKRSLSALGETTFDFGLLLLLLKKSAHFYSKISKTSHGRESKRPFLLLTLLKFMYNKRSSTKHIPALAENNFFPSPLKEQDAGLLNEASVRATKAVKNYENANKSP